MKEDEEQEREHARWGKTAYGKDLMQEAGTQGMKRTIQCSWSSESMVNYIYIFTIIHSLSALALAPMTLRLGHLTFFRQ